MKWSRQTFHLLDKTERRQRAQSVVSCNPTGNQLQRLGDASRVLGLCSDARMIELKHRPLTQALAIETHWGVRTNSAVSRVARGTSQVSVSA